MSPINRTRPNRQRRQAAESSTSLPAAATSRNTNPQRGAEPETAPAMERVGDLLRRRRQQRGDELDQIADYLCIRKSFLVALENNHYDELPVDTYVIGFLRSYAVYLGLDGTDAINRYRGEMAGRRRKPALVLPTPIAEGRTPSAFVMVGAAMAAILIYVLWYSFSTGGHAAVSVPPPLPPAAAASSPTPALAGGITLAGPPPAEPAPVGPSISPPVPPPAIVPAPLAAAGAQPVAGTAPATRLVIRAEKESWVVVADAKGHTVFDKVMKPGETWPVPDTQGLKLTTGNSGGIVLVLDGKDLPKLSRNSSILHDVALDPDKLGAGKPQPAAAQQEQQE